METVKKFEERARDLEGIIEQKNETIVRLKLDKNKLQ